MLPQALSLNYRVQITTSDIGALHLSTFPLKQNLSTPTTPIYNTVCCTMSGIVQVHRIIFPSRWATLCDTCSKEAHAHFWAFNVFNGTFCLICSVYKHVLLAVFRVPLKMNVTANTTHIFKKTEWLCKRSHAIPVWLQPYDQKAGFNGLPPENNYLAVMQTNWHYQFIRYSTWTSIDQSRPSKVLKDEGHDNWEIIFY